MKVKKQYSLYNWKSGDYISPALARQEFRYDWKRLPFTKIGREESKEADRGYFGQFLHIITGQWTNIVRAIGIANERDKSQKIGRALNVLMWVAIATALGSIRF